MIVAALDDLFAEENQKTFWSATVPSPFRDGLRYLWFTYPQPRIDLPPEVVEAEIDHRLAMRLLVTASQFMDETLVGIALPNRECTDTVVVIKILDASNSSADDRQRGLLIEDGFGRVEQTDYLHQP